MKYSQFETMPFPECEVRTLFSGERTITVRTGDELGKCPGTNTYRTVVREPGKDIGVAVRVMSVFNVPPGILGIFELPEEEAARAIRNAGGMNVDVIRFYSFDREGKALQ